MNETIDIYFEADSIAVASGSTPGIEMRDITVPEGQEWMIQEFGGSASITQTEVELLWSEDGGTTWSHPLDDGATKIRCLHLSSGPPAVFPVNIAFLGGTNTVLRIKAKNWSELATAEISSFIHGYKVK